MQITREGSPRQDPLTLAELANRLCSGFGLSIWLAEREVSSLPRLYSLPPETLRRIETLQRALDVALVALDDVRALAKPTPEEITPAREVRP